MFRIKRTKTTEPSKGVIQTTTLYATAVASNGSIGGFDQNDSKAMLVTAGIADRVKAYYATRPHAGTLVFEPVNATAAQLATAATDVKDLAATDFAALQAEVKRLEAECDKLISERSQALAAKGKAESSLADATAAIAQRDERIAVLENDLTIATEPKPADEPKADDAKPAEKKRR